MARRRKKAKAKSSTTNGGTGATTSEKTLPPLPPNAAHGAAFAPDTDTADESATGTPRATSPQRSNTMKVPGSQRRDRDRSPLSDDEHRGMLLRHCYEKLLTHRRRHNSTIKHIPRQSLARLQR